MKNHSFEELRTIMEQASSIVLTGHINPDGDAIGAVLALASSLEQLGKQVFVVLEPFGTKYEGIPNQHLIVEKEAVPSQVDLFIALDCGDFGRLDWLSDLFQNVKTTINIDHHSSNTYFAEYNHVEGESSSTCEVVYKLIKDFFPLDANIATALYAGLIYDTAGFRHSSTSPFTMEMAADLMGYGIPFVQIYADFFDRRSFTEMKAMGLALAKAEVLFDGKLSYTSMTEAEVQSVGSNGKELDGIINYIRGVEGTKVACFLYEKGANDIKISLRGTDGYDVAALAKKFGGGGHIKAAGGSFAGKIEEAREAVLAEIAKMI
ncbi:bifunctional oligoribonuclease/PAP phosphatase NrnA [Chakrabartyella piscis]|uniref:DHH family phosphoesterase n=1 Tax=Chakrabartyella piscis TaxID=2918914 RepID=UPI002958DBF4|nr:bifunctional oligoribonuclease/PAP phosphatase NrnA [Chakrabartyella piscis]